MIYDSQGRICLGKQLSEEMGYTPKTLVRMVYEGDKIFRLVPLSKLTDEDRVVGYDLKIDEKCRIIVPKDVRDGFDRHVLLWGVQKTGFLYIQFLATKQEERLAASIEALTIELKKQR